MTSAFFALLEHYFASLECPRRLGFVFQPNLHIGPIYQGQFILPLYHPSVKEIICIITNSGVPVLSHIG